jgi:hypothetical protein
VNRVFAEDHVAEASACRNDRPCQSCAGPPAACWSTPSSSCRLASARDRDWRPRIFLRKQLALYAERHARSRWANDATRLTLVVLARLIDWRAALTIVKFETANPSTHDGRCRSGHRTGVFSTVGPIAETAVSTTRRRQTGSRSPIGITFPPVTAVIAAQILAGLHHEYAWNHWRLDPRRVVLAAPL